jgi:UDP-glucose 4-epimerase
MARIAIFGGTGFIGQHLCERLLACGDTLVSFERDPVTSMLPTSSNLLDRQYGDFLAKSSFEGKLRGFDTVVHLANTLLPNTSNANPLRDVQENLIGSLGLIEEARRCGVRRFVFLSSGGTVYGKQELFPIKESTPSTPLCSYAIVKRSVESYLSLNRHLYDFDYFSLRVSNPYGPRQLAGGQGLVANVIAKAIMHEPITIWGDGSGVRDYLYVADVIDAIVMATRSTDQNSPRVLNIGSGIGKSIIDVVDDIENMIGISIERRFEEGRLVDVPKNVLDVSLARAVLGWECTRNWETGLRMTVDWALGYYK